MEALFLAALLILADFKADAEVHEDRRTPIVPRIRESLLQEGKLRLNDWYQVKSLLQLPMWRDGVKIQISKSDVPCGDPGDLDPVPVTFGEFEVAEVRPIDVYNALVNTSAQAAWDPTLSAIDHLGDWQDEGVVGLNYLYPSGLPFIPDREIFEWAAFSANFAMQDFMVVFSALANGRLHAAQPKRDGTVQLQNCLAAYWVRPNRDGGTRVTFTHHINLHAELGFSARFIFGFMWSKDVDWVNLLRSEAIRVSKQNRSLTETAVPAWLLRGPPLPGIDHHRKPISKFNLTEKGTFTIETGVGQDEARVTLVQAALCLIICATVCLVGRACWTQQNHVQASRAETSANILEAKAQDSESAEETTENTTGDLKVNAHDSDSESDSVVPETRGNCRCLTMTS